MLLFCVNATIIGQASETRENVEYNIIFLFFQTKCNHPEESLFQNKLLLEAKNQDLL